MQTGSPYRTRWSQAKAVAGLSLVIAAVLTHLAPSPSFAHDRSEARSMAPERAQATGVEYYVSQSGNDNNPGSLSQPFRTIAKGISVLQAGDTLNLRRGIHVEPVEIAGKHGTATNPIVIRSYP